LKLAAQIVKLSLNSIQASFKARQFAAWLAAFYSAAGAMIRTLSEPWPTKAGAKTDGGSCTEAAAESTHRRSTKAGAKSAH
jgi:hypothetical protein